MVRLIRIALIIAYILVLFAIVYYALQIDLPDRLRLSAAALMPAFLLYCFLCFSSVLWRPGFSLLFQKVRKPIWEEEVAIRGHLAAIRHKADDDHHYRMLLCDTDDWTAFAIGLRTIVISKKLLNDMDAQKLRAILAHEIGHLRSKDCVDGCAFMIAIMIPALMGKLVCYTSLKFNKKTRLFLSGIMLITLLLSLFISSKILITFVTIKIFPVIFHFLRKAFMIPWLTLGRVAEYRQDAFSASLGYALDLKSALLKLTAEGGAGPSVWSIIFTGSHPDLHNRIRRLEAYGGQRNEEGVVESVS